MEASGASGMNWDEFKEKAESVVASLGSSGLLCGDDVDDNDLNVCLLVPESCVALLIGKAGANINTTKSVSGANVSFQKKENSVRGYRKCFHQGTVASVMRAVSVAISVIQSSTGGACSATLVINHDAAGGVIGKGGENLKSVREQTSCKVSMEKAQEAMPAYGGRCLSLEHEESSRVSKAIYFCIRAKGFASPTAREDQQGPGQGAADYGNYGPMASAIGGAKAGARWTPYGAGAGGRQDVCAIHGKRRGKQNLRQSPNMPGQFICMDTDPCKGGAAGNGQMTGANYMMGGMGGVMGGMGAGMGALGMGMGDMFGMGNMYGMGMAANVCAIHGKKRGSKNLHPHPSLPGLYICLDSDSCKGGQAVVGHDMGGSMDVSSTCATHGKRRGARNLRPHPSQSGHFVCNDEDQCK